MSRVLLDACVLYPTVLRQVLLGAAEQGVFTPLWSERLLEEWARAGAKHGHEEMARAEIAAVRARWPDAVVAVSEATQERLWLPDPADIHVFAAAIDGGAEALITLNLKDFPTRQLTAEGVTRRDPDGFLVEALEAHPGLVQMVERVLNKATAAGIEGSHRAILKRARLPRLGKALATNEI